ncbi:MAG: extracellular solute-binding protein [Clostridiales bacterium]|nr:extracellular solute-binding protein [Clostridiales bacterium]
MKKLLAMLLALMIVLPLCAVAEGTDWTTPYDELVTVSVGRPDQGFIYPGEGENYMNNPYHNWIRDTFNFQLDPYGEFGWLALEGHGQKVTLAITSREMPDILQVDQKQLQDLLGSDLIVDLAPYIEEYASPMVKDVIAAHGGIQNYFFKSYYEGGVYAISGAEPSYQDSLLWIRMDWLEKAGMEVPTNLEELTAVARKFKELDLAGGGRTVPIEIQTSSWGFYGAYNTPCAVDPIFNNMQAYPRLWYKNDEGKFVYGSVQETMKKPLKLLADWYAEGLLAIDFASRDHVASLAAGNSGITFGPWWSNGWPLYDSMANNEGALWMPIPFQFSEDGTYYSFGVDPSAGRYFVVSANCEHPEVAVKLLNIMTEKNVIANFGEALNVNGKVYERTLPADVYHAYDGVAGVGNASWPIEIYATFPDGTLQSYKRSNANWEGWYNDGIVPEGATESTIMNYEKRKAWYAGEDTSIGTWQNVTNLEAQNLNVKYAENYNLLNNVYPLPTRTMNSRWGDLGALEITTVLSIIKGEKPIEYFDTFVKDWMSQGGERIINEVNAAFQ